MDLGPADATRSAAAAPFLERALAVAGSCGITRLADITGLDRLGLPVWQAVRPAGRSLSVHQGKGASPLDARIGALCEGIESHCAENAPADGPCCKFAALPPSQRAPDIGNYCETGHSRLRADQPIQWCHATDLATGSTCYLPHPLVSLDYRSGLPSPFDRTSSGLAAGASADDSVRAALLEVLERDAVGDWHRSDEEERLATSLDLADIPFDWFRYWRERLMAFDVDLEVFRLASIVRVPVFKCVIGAVEEFGMAYRLFSGTAAHGNPETALFKALAEAIQSRLTYIAGVRDDILPAYYHGVEGSRRPGGGPLPGRRRWEEDELAGGLDEMVRRLAALGYRDIAVKSLAADLPGIWVTKAFVPGLGSLSRIRRPAL